MELPENITTLNDLKTDLRINLRYKKEFLPIALERAFVECPFHIMYDDNYHKSYEHIMEVINQFPQYDIHFILDHVSREKAMKILQILEVK